MAKKTPAKPKPRPKIPGTPKPGPTGRYAYCPNSSTKHTLFAKEVLCSESGNLWFKCVCGFRGYFPRGNPLPTYTREAVLKAGARIPDEF